MNLRADMINEIDRVASALDRSQATVSYAVANDGKFYKRLKEGGSCTTDTYERVMEKLYELAPPA